jgi:hypothetical protein
VSVTLNYENEEKVPLDVIFAFCMNEDSTIYGYKALVDRKKSVAELKDKKKVLGMNTLSPPILLNGYLSDLYQMQYFKYAGSKCTTLHYFLLFSKNHLGRGKTYRYSK